MGLTSVEQASFAVGTGLLVLFLLNTAAPRLKGILDGTADRTARHLREDFLDFSRRQARTALLLAGFLSGGVAAATGGIHWAALMGPMPVLLSGTIVRRIRTVRLRRIVSQLPGFLDVMAGHVRAGRSLPEALCEAVPLLPRGIREEAAWLHRLLLLGTPLAEAFRLWELRLRNETVALVARPLRIAVPSGGNIVELLERSRDVLRAKLRMEEKLRAMTAQARLQATVLTLLPPVFIAVLSRIDGDFLPRCLGTPVGRLLLAASAVLQLLGWITIRRILAARS